MDQTSQYPGTSRALFGCEENHLGGLGFSARPAGKFKVTLVTGRFKRKHESTPRNCGSERRRSEKVNSRGFSFSGDGTLRNVRVLFVWKDHAAPPLGVPVDGLNTPLFLHRGLWYIQHSWPYDLQGRALVHEMFCVHMFILKLSIVGANNRNIDSIVLRMRRCVWMFQHRFFETLRLYCISFRCQTWLPALGRQCQVLTPFSCVRVWAERLPRALRPCPQPPDLNLPQKNPPPLLSWCGRGHSQSCQQLPARAASLHHTLGIRGNVACVCVCKWEGDFRYTHQGQ